MTLPPRVVVVHRRTELDELLDRHATRGAAQFFLQTRGRTLDEVAERHELLQAARRTVAAAIPMDWRRGEVERGDLPRFLFEPGDVVVVVGQDGLVANTAKYLAGQPVIGIDPEPGVNPAVLVQHPAGAAAELLRLAVDRAVERHLQPRTMVEAVTDDGRRVVALNEVYVGHASHQTSRWTITDPAGGTERQGSSGLIVATGTGATGWCWSVWQERHSGLALPGPTEQRLAWFVREAWPSPTTGTEHTEGEIDRAAHLEITVASDRLVAFGDGIEADAVDLTWGQSVRLGVAPEQLRLLVS